VAGHSGGARWLAGELAGEINGVEMGLICLQAGGRGERKKEGNGGDKVGPLGHASRTRTGGRGAFRPPGEENHFPF
jgi:hypothetical protein